MTIASDVQDLAKNEMVATAVGNIRAEMQGVQSRISNAIREVDENIQRGTDNDLPGLVSQDISSEAVSFRDTLKQFRAYLTNHQGFITGQVPVEPEV